MNGPARQLWLCFGIRSIALNHTTKLQLYSSGSILRGMNELDEVWTKMLAEATSRARASDQHHVADYLDLKASNDLIRRASVGWLLETLIQHAASANRLSGSIAIERTEPHNFGYRGANLVGTSVSLRYGVRCLTVEAGWTRTPADGFMRGGMLAFARFRHFGLPKAGMEAALLRSGDSPVWRVLIDEKPGADIDSADLHRHVALLTAG
jgi:hypothetical protein